MFGVSYQGYEYRAVTIVVVVVVVVLVVRECICVGNSSSSSPFLPNGRLVQINDSDGQYAQVKGTCAGIAICITPIGHTLCIG